MIAAEPLTVSETVIFSRSMPSKATSKSRSESTAMPTRPISPIARSSSESRPIWEGRSKATFRPVWPFSIRNLKRSLVSCWITKTRVLAHGPGPFTVHFLVYAAGKRVLAGQADHIYTAGCLEILRRIGFLNLNTGFIENRPGIVRPVFRRSAAFFRLPFCRLLLSLVICISR